MNNNSLYSASHQWGEIAKYLTKNGIIKMIFFLLNLSICHKTQMCFSSI